MSGPAYMHASIATPWFAANHQSGNGWDHLRIVEHPDEHIIFPSWCSSLYTFMRNSTRELQSSTELRQIGPYQVLPLQARVGLRVMKGYSIFPKAPHYWSLSIRWFNVISRKLMGKVLPLCREVVGVFYSPSWQGFGNIPQLLVKWYHYSSS